MVNDVYLTKGKVVEITPSNVIVQIAAVNYLIRFDTDGKACDNRDIYKGNTESNGIPGTFEGGPWELADISAEEREAVEQGIRRKWSSRPSIIGTPRSRMRFGSFNAAF